MYPNISVITSVLNGADTLEATIRSVVAQVYPNVEYIVIDGASNDGTVDILRKYDSKLDFWVTEPDAGISDAFNKGISRASGEYIIFQGCGDGFVSEYALSDLMEGVDPERHMLVSGRIDRIQQDNSLIYTSKSIKKFNKHTFLFKMPFPHQGLLIHRKLFEKFGLFDINCRFAMDYEHLLRMYHDFPEVKLSDKVVAQWRDDGIGTGRIEDVLAEYHQIKLRNRVASKSVLICIDKWIRLKYFVAKQLGKR